MSTRRFFAVALVVSLLVAGVARHVGKVLIAGFSLNRGYTVEEYDEHCARVGL